MKIFKTLEEAKKELTERTDKGDYVFLKQYDKNHYIVYDDVDLITLNLLREHGIMGVYNVD